MPAADSIRFYLAGSIALPLLLVAGGCSSASDTDGPGTSTTTGTGGSAGATSTGGSGGGAASGGSPAVDFCEACHDPSVQGAIQDPELDAASGLAASKRHDDVYYAHNDAGDSPRFFATNLLGEALATYELTGAEHVDWEDCAVGPCPDLQCLYLADIGDNTLNRSSYVVYRVAEPIPISAGTHQVTFESFPFQYPDGNHDANTLLVHPDTEEIVVITTVFGGPSAAYRFPLPLQPEQLVTLEPIGEVEPPSGSPEITGGDVQPNGLGILLLTRTDLFFLPMAPGPIASSLGGLLCDMPRAVESQAEAVAWTLPGTGYATVSQLAAASFSLVTCAVQ